MIDPPWRNLCYCLASAGEEVGQFMVRKSPRISWIRGTLSTPNSAKGQLARERVV
jgi:hypothetical protein